MCYTGVQDKNNYLMIQFYGIPEKQYVEQEKRLLCYIPVKNCAESGALYLPQLPQLTYTSANSHFFVTEATLRLTFFLVILQGFSNAVDHDNVFFCQANPRFSTDSSCKAREIKPNIILLMLW